MQNFSNFRRRNQSLVNVDSKISFGHKTSKGRLVEPRGLGSKKRSPGKLATVAKTDGDQLSRDVQAARNALAFKTPRNSMLAGTKNLPTLATVEQVQVYNSNSLKSPMHLNNIMISVKRKLEEPAPSNVSKKSQSRLTNGKLAIPTQNFNEITSLNIMTGRSLAGKHQAMSPMIDGKKNPSLT